MQINRQTYEEFFLLYADGELSERERKEVESFIEQNPDLKGEFNLISETIMVPDESIVFNNKEILFRNEDNRKVVMMRWVRYAAAAVVLIALSITGWLFIDENTEKTPPVAVLEEKKTEKTPAAKENINQDNNITDAGKQSNIVAEKPSITVKRAENKVENKTPAAPENTVNETQETPVAVVEEPEVPQPALDPVAVNNDVAFVEPENAPIDVAVAPREMTGAEKQETPGVHYTQSVNEEREKSDMIYFANTSLTKKTKLRGVLRKATRYLERVTSIQ